MSGLIDPDQVNEPTERLQDQCQILQQSLRYGLLSDCCCCFIGHHSLGDVDDKAPDFKERKRVKLEGEVTTVV